MNTIQLRCDRCGEFVEAYIDENADGVIITEGFYDVTKMPWKKYRRGEEGNVCENCINNDPEYKNQK